MTLQLARHAMGRPLGANTLPGGITVVEPPPPDAPPSANVRVVDAFNGTGAWDSLIWETAGQTGFALTQAGGLGNMTADAGYQKAIARTVEVFTGGEAVYDVKLTTKDEYTVALWCCGQEDYFPNYIMQPVNGYWVEIVPITGATSLRKSVSESGTVLATMPDTSGTTYAVGDTVHVAIRPRASGVGAWIWRNDEVRPSSPTLVSTDTTWTNGRMGVAMQTGGAKTYADIDTVSYDPLT